MTNWQKTKLTFEFNTVAVNNTTMTLGILQNDRILQKPILMPEGISVLTYDIELPTKITLIAGNRGVNSTIVDEHQNIVKNMTITINSIQLDGLPCHQSWVENFLITEVDDSDEIIIGSVMCANGKTDIFFNDTDAFHCVVKTKIF